MTAPPPEQAVERRAPAAGALRIALVTWGTRGDVQPYIALGGELEARGHRVVVAVSEDHAPWARRSGLPIAPLPFDFRALMTSARAAAWSATGDTGAFLTALAEAEHERRHAIADALIEACSGADAVVAGFLIAHRAAAVAEARGVPFARALTFPVEPTAAYPSPFLGNGASPLERAALRLRSHVLARSIALRAQRDDLNDLRRRLALAAVDDAEDDLRRREVPAIHLFDERVLPRPDDWPRHAVVAGYCPLTPEMRARLGESSAEIDAWLGAGPIPLFFGFGSVPVQDSAALLAIVADLCADLGTRAIVSAGWSRIAVAANATVRVVGALDHDAVLPRCAVAVHHGGAGTTAATLTAGVPTVVCSVFGDQALWGQRVAALGVGATFPFQRLGRARLTEAVRTGLRDDVRARAAALGRALRGVDGRRRAADALIDGIGRAGGR